MVRSPPSSGKFFLKSNWCPSSFGYFPTKEEGEQCWVFLGDHSRNEGHGAFLAHSPGSPFLSPTVYLPTKSSLHCPIVFLSASVSLSSLSLPQLLSLFDLNFSHLLFSPGFSSLSLYLYHLHLYPCLSLPPSTPLVFIWGFCASVSLCFEPQAVLLLPVCLCTPLSFSSSGSLCPCLYWFTCLSVLVPLVVCLSSTLSAALSLFWFWPLSLSPCDTSLPYPLHRYLYPLSNLLSSNLCSCFSLSLSLPLPLIFLVSFSLAFPLVSFSLSGYLSCSVLLAILVSASL